MKLDTRRPLLIVVSAPSGAGKTTLCDRLLVERKDIAYSVSCTTRPRRGAEVAGEDYFFISEDEFTARVAAGEFLEHAVVHGCRYGTLRTTVLGAMADGRSVLMDIDVQGARQIREAITAAPPGDPVKAGFVDIFISPPSMEALRERLERRGEDSEDVIARRLANARHEMADRDLYRYRVVNGDVAQAYEDLKRCVEQEEIRMEDVPL